MVNQGKFVIKYADACILPLSLQSQTLDKENEYRKLTIYKVKKYKNNADMLSIFTNISPYLNEAK